MDFFLGQNRKKEKEENPERGKKGNETKRKPSRAAYLRKLLIIKYLSLCKHQLLKKQSCIILLPFFINFSL